MFEVLAGETGSFGVDGEIGILKGSRQGVLRRFRHPNIHRTQGVAEGYTPKAVAGIFIAVHEQDPAALAAFLEMTYGRFNRPEYISPDPLEVARDCPDIRDREIAALVASSLAVGRAGLIVGAARDALARMGGTPRDFLDSSGTGDIAAAFAGFRYRFFSGDDVAALLFGARGIIDEWGSLGAAFSDFAGSGPGSGEPLPFAAGTLAPALDLFVREVRERAALAKGLPRDTFPYAKNLLPSPTGGSACKRPFLMLRWLVRQDAVDPGGWDPSLASRLVQPMDTHMSWVARRLGFAPESAPPNLATALAVTARFREFCPGDPTRYDFALTRPGIRPDLDRGEWFP